jgi:methyl-accepting chemotaxis protein
MMKRRFKDFGIQSKLVPLVLATTSASMLLTGLLGFWPSSSSMQQAGYQQLASFRNARAEAIREHLEQLGSHIMTISEFRIMIEGLQAFAKTYNELSDIDVNQAKKLMSQYESSLASGLIKYLDSSVSMATYYSASKAERYLKYHYVATPSEAHKKFKDGAKYGSTWSDVHRKYHSRFARIANLFGYEDILLVDAKSSVHAIGSIGLEPWQRDSFTVSKSCLADGGSPAQPTIS